MAEEFGMNRSQRDLYAQWRRNLIRLCWVFGILVVVSECVITAVLWKSGQIIEPIEPYAALYLLLPTGLILSALCAGTAAAKSSRLSERKRNEAPVVALCFCCGVLVCNHGMFSGISAVFTLPVLLSLIYGEVRFTKWIAHTSWLLIAVGLVINLQSGRFHDLQYGMNYGIGLMVFTAVCLTVPHFLRYQRGICRALEDTSEERRSLRRQLSMDPLTELLNHTAFFTELRRAIPRCQEMGRPLVLAMLDIDGFKTINDTFGHEKGNVVLLWLARLLREEGEGAVAARYGGEEFVMIFECRSLYTSAEVMERLRCRFAGHAFPELDRLSVTFSCGIAALGDYMDEQTLIEEADRAMYRAKALGKNRMVFAEDPATAG